MVMTSEEVISALQTRDRYREKRDAQQQERATEREERAAACEIQEVERVRARTERDA